MIGRNMPHAARLSSRFSSFFLAALAALLLGLCPAPRLAAQQVPLPHAPPPAAAAPATAQPGPATGQEAAAATETQAAPAQAAPAQEPAAAAESQAAPAQPAPAETPADTRALDQEVQGLKKDVVDLNRDLFVLEEELLFPANTQVAVFLSMDVGDFFALDAVTLKIDQKEVINYLYTPREVEALLKGGVHRLYLGNLKVGPHELVAFFTGKGPDERPYKRGATLKFEKGIGAKYLELKINDRQRRQQPEFEIKDWE
ncbi:MAG TPA: hypothetical protein VIY54_03020 [Steroidobacteraceae bacterium]